MSAKKVKCPVCNTHNWSGNLYCEKCSGPLFEEKDTVDIYQPVVYLATKEQV